jgi:hypothetical protein
MINYLREASLENIIRSKTNKIWKRWKRIMGLLKAIETGKQF